MVFSSVPVYLDPPNWNNQQQQQQHQHQAHQHGHQLPSGGGGGGGGGMELHHHQQHQLPPMPPPGGSLMAPRPDMAMVVASSNGGGGGAGTGGPTSGSLVRPNSMTERARLAKIPQPEPGLNCPRCESTNTKFCYFNNYSLSQPRHFCKTCRRYWTRGGALRNVPVGGGCRRNKRTKSSKSSNSSSAAASGSAAGGTSSSTSSTATGGSSAAAAATIMPPQAQLPFLASLHHQFGGDHYGTGPSRLGFPGLSSLDPVDYQLGGGGGGAGTGMGLEQWRLPQIQQFSFLTCPDGVPPPMSGIYSFDLEAGGDGGGFAGHMMGGSKSKVPNSAGLITQMASVKMEDNPPSTVMTSSPREFLGLPGNLQFWGGGNGAGGNNGGNANGNGNGSSGVGAIAPGSGWMDLSGFNSSSSGNIL